MGFEGTAIPFKGVTLDRASPVVLTEGLEILSISV